MYDAWDSGWSGWGSGRCCRRASERSMQTACTVRLEPWSSSIAWTSALRSPGTAATGRPVSMSHSPASWTLCFLMCPRRSSWTRAGADEQGARPVGVESRCNCASSRPASLSRTATSRVSTASCVTSASTSTGSRRSTTPVRRSKPGGWSTIVSGRTARWETRHRRSSGRPSRDPCRHVETCSDSHYEWTKDRGQVNRPGFA